MGMVNLILRRMWVGSFKKKECAHLDQIQDITPNQISARSASP